MEYVSGVSAGGEDDGGVVVVAGWWVWWLGDSDGYWSDIVDYVGVFLHGVWADDGGGGG